MEQFPQKSRPFPRREQGKQIFSREAGYTLIAVLFLVVMVLIALSAAAPRMAADIERDREVELIHRGQQYIRAIKLYYKRFGSYPPSVDALMKTNEIRFLRKRYKDPMTGKDDWHLIHFGENKTPSYGFFGQPISGAGGATVAGVGPGGGGTTGTGLGGASATNGTSGTTGGPLFGGSQLTGNPSTGGTDSSSGTSGSTGSSDSSGASNGGTPSGGLSGSSGSTSGGSSGSSSSGFGSSSSFGNTNPLTVGGLGIIGVESVSPKPSILVWKKKTHFNEWEFWYDPMADQVMMMNNLGQQGATGTGQNSTGQSGFSNGSGFSGTSSTSNSSGSTTTSTPTTPQTTTSPQ